jgi:hypothetical protein
MTPKIILPDGSPILEDSFKPKVFGYQIVHKITGRILPGTTREQIYSKAAAISKMNWVIGQFAVQQHQIDIWEYELCPIYEHDKPKKWNYIVDKNDYLY